MVELLSSAKVPDALEKLTAARDELSLLTTSGDKLAEYRTWANRQALQLGRLLSPESLDQIVTTRRHWQLQNIDSATYGLALESALSVTIAEANFALENSIVTLKERHNTWGYKYMRQTHAVVLDTNILMAHLDDLLTIKWWTHANSFRAFDPLRLVIPIAVVKELDKLKLSTGEMVIKGKRHSRRSLARAALKQLDEWFIGNRTFTWNMRDESSLTTQGELSAGLLIDELSHVPLEQVDAEIIDQALRLRPYAASVSVATDDASLRFRARKEGLEAFTIDTPSGNESE